MTNYDATVSVINTDPASGAAYNTQIAKLSTGGVKLQPVGVAISSDGAFAYVANGKDTVSVISTKTNTIVQTLPIDSVAESGAHSVALSPDGTRIYVTDFRDDNVRVLSLTRGNTAPLAIANPTVGAANPTTGAVTGLVNIKDPDGDPLSYSAVVAPTKGSLTFDPATGTYTYTPTQAARDAAAQNPGLTDTFTIRATDNPGNASTTTTNLTVPILSSGNHAPVPDGPSYFAANDPVTGVVNGTVGVSDPDGDALSYEVVYGPWDGTLDFDSATGAFTFTPYYESRAQRTLWGEPTTNLLTFAVSDGQATVYKDIEVEIAPVRLVPSASPGVYSVDPSTGTVTGSMYAVDYEGNPLSYTLISAPAHGGMVSIDATGTFTYTPEQVDRGVFSTDTFTVAVTGGQDTINVPVTVPIRPPEVEADKTHILLGAWPDFLATKDSRVYVLNAGDSTVSVIDTDTNTVIATSGQLPAGGAMALSPDGTRLYVADYVGTHVYVLDARSLALAGAPINVVTTYGGTLAVSPDGKRLYVGSVARDGEYRLFGGLRFSGRHGRKERHRRDSGQLVIGRQRRNHP